MGDRINAAKAGASTLTDWSLADGGEPVEIAKAEHRSLICRHGADAGVPCPNNWTGDWWSILTKAAALAVLSERAAKFRRKIETSNEQMLGTCKACLCYLPVKVLVPIEHILKNTTDEVWNKLPPYCWIKREGSALRESNKADK